MIYVTQKILNLLTYYMYVVIIVNVGTFHLLHMLIDDYISHSLETLIEDEAHRAHFININLPTPGTL